MRCATLQKKSVTSDACGIGILRKWSQSVVIPVCECSCGAIWTMSWLLFRALKRSLSLNFPATDGSATRHRACPGTLKRGVGTLMTHQHRRPQSAAREMRGLPAAGQVSNLRLLRASDSIFERHRMTRGKEATMLTRPRGDRQVIPAFSRKDRPLNIATNRPLLSPIGYGGVSRITRGDGAVEHHRKATARRFTLHFSRTESGAPKYYETHKSPIPCTRCRRLLQRRIGIFFVPIGREVR